MSKRQREQDSNESVGGSSEETEEDEESDTASSRTVSSSHNGNDFDSSTAAASWGSATASERRDNALLRHLGEPRNVSALGVDVHPMPSTSMNISFTHHIDNEQRCNRLCDDDAVLLHLVESGALFAELLRALQQRAEEILAPPAPSPPDGKNHKENMFANVQSLEDIQNVLVGKSTSEAAAPALSADEVMRMLESDKGEETASRNAAVPPKKAPGKTKPTKPLPHRGGKGAKAGVTQEDQAIRATSGLLSEAASEWADAKVSDPSLITELESQSGTAASLERLLFSQRVESRVFEKECAQRRVASDRRDNHH